MTLLSTVKPVLRGHISDKEKMVVFWYRWPLKFVSYMYIRLHDWRSDLEIVLINVKDETNV